VVEPDVSSSAWRRARTAVPRASLHRRHRPLPGALAACFAVCLSLFVFVGSAAAQEPLDCAKDEPEGWTVITTASSPEAGQQFVCNYQVRTKGNLSGTAITIEYFCDTAEGADRFKSITASPRKTETQRVNGELLVIEEGPKAKNPDNPQSQGVFSTFFDVDFTLMEKEWRMLSPQVLTTIVVLTNDRGILTEAERHGVVRSEPVARSLANANRSVMPCNIPAVGGATSTRKGKGPVVVIALGGTAVLIGGYTVWKRRKLPFAPPAPPVLVAGGVPPKCSGLAELFDQENAKLATLQEAAADLRRQVDRAERIHQNNIIKAKLVVGIEIASAFAGPALDLAVAMRRNYMQSIFRSSDGGALGQLDNWKPPGSISAKMAALLEQADAAVQAALSKFKRLRQQADEMGAALERVVNELPVVKEARENFHAARRRLGEIEEEFRQCEILRKQWDDLTAASEANNKQAIHWHGLVQQHANRLQDIEGRIAQAKGKLGVREMLQRDIAKIKMDMEGIEDTMRLGDLADDLQAKTAQLVRHEAEPDVKQALAELPGLEASLGPAKRDFESISKLAQPELDKLSARSTELSNQRRETSIKLYQNENRTLADVEEQRQILGRAGENAESVRFDAWKRRSGDVEAAESAANTAATEHQQALSRRDDLRLQASQTPLELPSEPSVASQVLSGIGNLLKFPFTVLGELVFGVGQSPDEIMEILRVGRTNVMVLHSHIDAVDLAGAEQNERTDLLRRKLDRCVKANSPKADTAQQPVPATSAP
jgi:hypothetical protein